MFEYRSACPKPPTPSMLTIVPIVRGNLTPSQCPALSTPSAPNGPDRQLPQRVDTLARHSISSHCPHTLRERLSASHQHPLQNLITREICQRRRHSCLRNRLPTSHSAEDRWSVDRSIARSVTRQTNKCDPDPIYDASSVRSVA